MERRVKKSDPDFEKLFNLANDLVIAMNPQRWFNLAGPEKRDFAEPERLAVVAEIRNQLEEAMKDPKFPDSIKEFIEKMDFSKLDEAY